MGLADDWLNVKQVTTIHFTKNNQILSILVINYASRFVAYQTGRIGQSEHGRTVDDDLFISISEREIETRSSHKTEN